MGLAHYGNRARSFPDRQSVAFEREALVSCHALSGEGERALAAWSGSAGGSVPCRWTGGSTRRRVKLLRRVGQLEANQAQIRYDEFRRRTNASISASFRWAVRYSCGRGTASALGRSERWTGEFVLTPRACVPGGRLGTTRKGRAAWPEWSCQDSGAYPQNSFPSAPM